MLKKLSTYLKITQQMGLRYMVFRVLYELKNKSGLLQRKFPTKYVPIQIPSLKEWKNYHPLFFQWKVDNLEKLNNDEIEKLANRINNFIKGEIRLFSGMDYLIPSEEWHQNPLTGFKYNKSQHWSKIPEFTKEAGDIKYVWEKARFSWVYDFIRYDQCTNRDSSQVVFNSILSFIDQNPINQGPNYICSQEISLRVLNWVFALYYYNDSKTLNQEIYDAILQSINAQIGHVYANINFSRIAVRNNHAITETLALYLVGILFPFFSEANQWRKDGKKWFENEVAYQIYEDGSYLQYSMNYHRIVVQLLTWAIVLSENNNDPLAQLVYEKAKKCIRFLEACQDPVSGKLPHYGNNDGALFFPMNSANYRDFRPQINGLRAALNMAIESEQGYNSLEELHWLGLKTLSFEPSNQQSSKSTHQHSESNEFSIGGYYTHKDKNTLTFLRCGSHKNRPSQTDNLHLDVWVDGINLLRDAGTYLYNGNPDETSYFNSTKAHNTVQIGDKEQMEKGARFIWFNWSECLDCEVKDTNDFWQFSGSIKAFGNSIHHRTVKRYKHTLRWEVIDNVKNKDDNEYMYQHWHPNETTKFKISFSSMNDIGEVIKPVESNGWYAPNYGVKEKSKMCTFSTIGTMIKTIIEVVT